jgi:hypothetical protein
MATKTAKSSRQSAKEPEAPKAEEPVTPEVVEAAVKAIDAKDAEAAAVEAAIEEARVVEPGHDNGRVWRKRTDADVLSGEFCTVTDGPEAGTYAVFVEGHGEKDGFPETATIKSRDDRDVLLTVPYASLRPDVPGRR